MAKTVEAKLKAERTRKEGRSNYLRKLGGPAGAFEVVCAGLALFAAEEEAAASCDKGVPPVPLWKPGPAGGVCGGGVPEAWAGGRGGGAWSIPSTAQRWPTDAATLALLDSLFSSWRNVERPTP